MSVRNGLSPTDWHAVITASPDLAYAACMSLGMCHADDSPVVQMLVIQMTCSTIDSCTCQLEKCVQMFYRGRTRFGQLPCRTAVQPLKSGSS